MSRLWWRLIRFIARLCVWGYYRRFRVEGVERIPRTGPLLFVANHPNSLVDAGAVLLASPRPVSFVAKSTLFTMPVVRWFLRGLGAVPVFRPSDRTGQSRKNMEMFSAFTEHFRRGGAVVVFPEGVSHADPELKEVKSGPARLAIDAETGAAFQLGLKVVPVGLHYEPRQRFRGEVLVRIGEAFDVADLASVHRREAIRAVQERIADALRPLVLHLERTDLEPLVRGVSEVYDEYQRANPEGLRPRSRAEVVQTAGACLNHFLVADPAAVQTAERRLRRYRRLARRAGVGGLALASRARRGVAWIGFLRLVIGMALGFPLFLVGVLTSYVPYRATDALARHYATSQGRDSLPILRMAAAIVCFGVFWGLLGVLVYLWSRSLGFTAFFAVGVLGCAFYARFYAERLWSWRARLAGMVPLIRPGIARVARARDDLLEHVNRLAARYQVETGVTLLAPRRRSWVRRVPWRAASIVAVIGAAAWFAWGLRDEAIAEIPDRPSPWVSLGAVRARAQLERDVRTLGSVLDTLEALEVRMHALKTDFDARRRQFTDVEDDRAVRQVLLSYLSCRSTLFHLAWTYRVPDRAGEREASEKAFVLGYVAALALVRRGMQLVTTFDGNPNAIRKLNEGDFALSVPPRAYDRIRRNLGSAAILEELGAATARHRHHVEWGAPAGGPPWDRIAREARQGEAVVGELAERHWAFKWDSAVARARTAIEEGRYSTSRFFAGLVGGVRVREGDLAEGLISREQVESLRTETLRPGDILIERRNWALSNVFLPGFWTHAALYVGGEAGLRSLGIEEDPRVRPHRAALARTDAHGRARVVLEALAPGVVLNSLEESVGEADAVCVLRPRLSPAQIAEAVARALSHYGKPYDFDFDFFSTDRLVCTELIYQAYAGPLAIETQAVMGRETLPAIAFVQKWARERGQQSAQLELAGFLDGVEEEGRARPGDARQLVATLERPGLTLLQSHGGSSRGPRALLLVLCSLALLGLLLLRRRD